MGVLMIPSLNDPYRLGELCSDLELNCIFKDGFLGLDRLVRTLLHVNERFSKQVSPTLT